MKGFAYYPLVAKCIPEELSMNYPVEEHRELLIDYIYLAINYETPLNLRFTLGGNLYLFEELINHVRYNSYKREREMPTEIRFRLDSLSNEIKPLVIMYKALSFCLHQAKFDIQQLGELPKDVRLFMLNYLVSYRHASIYYDELPELPSEISNLYGYTVPVTMKDEVYERVINEYDSFMNYWYLYKGLAVL